ncbi:MAG: arginine repressor [Gammaproteobacteria bacterium]
MQTDLQQSGRRSTILRILRGAHVRKQEDIVRLLREAGHDVTQSSVSRDLRELGVLKAGGRYLAPQEATRPLEDFGALRPFVLGVATAGASLTVLRTATGSAQTVAAAIDKAEWPEVVGTISGDDTIFIATDTTAAQSAVVARLRNLFRL